MHRLHPDFVGATSAPASLNTVIRGNEAPTKPRVGACAACRTREEIGGRLHKSVCKCEIRRRFPSEPPSKTAATDAGRRDRSKRTRAGATDVRRRNPRKQAQPRWVSTTHTRASTTDACFAPASTEAVAKHINPPRIRTYLNRKRSAVTSLSSTLSAQKNALKNFFEKI